MFFTTPKIQFKIFLLKSAIWKVVDYVKCFGAFLENINVTWYIYILGHFDKHNEIDNHFNSCGKYGYD